MRPTVTIQAPANEAASTPRQLTLQTGQSATFGHCACGTCPIDLPLPAAPAGWFAGQATATDDHWLLTNLSDDSPLIVENLENPHEYLTVEPRRCRAPVAFELARVTPAGTSHAPDLTVFGPEPRRIRRHTRQCQAPRRTRPLLDPRSTYYAVLHTLCRPRIAGPVTAALPTSADIAAILSSDGTRLTARAVDAHIEYVTDKLGLRRGTSRDALVATAIRRGMLT